MIGNIFELDAELLELLRRLRVVLMQVLPAIC